jgi:hypothetical protein
MPKAKVIDMSNDEEFSYGDVTGEQLKRIGFNGFLNTVTKEVLFCARAQHLILIRNGELDGVPKRLYGKPVSEEGSRTSEGSVEYAGIYAWTASYNWVHFVSEEKQDGRVMSFTSLSDKQDKVAARFAAGWKATMEVLQHPTPDADSFWRNVVAQKESDDPVPSDIFSIYVKNGASDFWVTDEDHPALIINVRSVGRMHTVRPCFGTKVTVDIYDLETSELITSDRELRDPNEYRFKSVEKPHDVQEAFLLSKDGSVPSEETVEFFAKFRTMKGLHPANLYQPDTSTEGPL